MIKFAAEGSINDKPIKSLNQTQDKIQINENLLKV